jgi:hypothetical protein
MVSVLLCWVLLKKARTSDTALEATYASVWCAKRALLPGARQCGANIAQWQLIGLGLSEPAALPGPAFWQPTSRSCVVDFADRTEVWCYTRERGDRSRKRLTAHVPWLL